MSSRKLFLTAVCLLFAVLAVSARLAVAMPAAQESEPVKPSGPDTGEPFVVDNVTEVLTGTQGLLLSVEPAAAIMSQGFEGAWPAVGWELDDLSSNDGGEFLWGKRTCHPHGGSYAGWSVGGGAHGGALSCDANYPNYTHTWAVYGPFDLRNATSASLTYYVYGRTESSSTCAYDWLFVGSSTDGTWFNGTAMCGDWTTGPDGNGYTRRTLDLSNRLGQSRVWVGFQMASNYSIVFNGMTVDDLTLDVVGTMTPTDTPTPRDTPTVTPTPTRTPPSQGRVQLPLIMNRLVATRTATPTATAPPPTALFPHADYTLQRAAQATVSDIAIRPAWPSREWTYTLNGDITGNQYYIDLTLYSIVYPAGYLIEIILDQNGIRTTLASDHVAVWGTGRINRTLSGLDPAAAAGDHLILRISHTSGAYGGTLIGGNTNAHIGIPGDG